MIKKFAFLLPGVAAFVLAGAPMLSVQAQAPSGGTPRTERRMGNKLNLSDTQKAQMKQIRESAKSQMRAVLTADQQARLDAAGQQKGKRGEVMQSLNLSDDQKARIRSIMQTSRQQMDALLTAEQRALRDQMKNNRRGGQRQSYWGSQRRV
ncbi:Spy/CpxP family protein refolding chaperone [Myxacorys almedinensis]|uniref:P pilus assembly/Cpx signaling pathway, periplasmic inhibitor/zinc-resistance associated protein n=1 Tax=Myxacorys almedinensis A TaxID=2690445 RepID=A0A8J7Z3E3_9CYAN|nr:Spy/CpxP family protein refolding chaperone [Myxacorys almedinensis]NDJ19252.1 hypothetical protein [Myxacorys almedinensis A]